MGTHFSIYSENHGVQAVPLNFARSSDITYVRRFFFLIQNVALEGALEFVFSKRWPFGEDSSAPLARQVLVLAVLVVHVFSANVPVLGSIAAQLATPISQGGRPTCGSCHHRLFRHHVRQHTCNCNHISVYLSD